MNKLHAVATKTALSTKAAIVLVTIFLALMGGTIGYLVVQGYRDTQDRASEKAAAGAQALAINTGWVVEVASRALRSMDSALGPFPERGESETTKSVSEALQSLPVSAKAYIIGPDGRALYSTDQELVDIDVRDRSYFAIPATGQGFYTSELLTSRLNGAQIFVFSRRIERRGEFAGVAVISFEVALLADMWSALDLDPGSTVSLIRSDGKLVARYPFADGPLDLSDHVLFTQYLPQSDVGTYSSAASPVDGVPRVVGYRRVIGTELVALASVGMTEVLARFWRNVGIFLGLVLPVLLALAAAALWIIRLLQRDAGKQAELARALETNTMLFREIHHRVKNNLQSMQSLVRMQELTPTSKQDLQSRFIAMAAVHEHMYQHDAYAELDAPSFIASVAEPIITAYGSQVELSLDIDQVPISHDYATPVALLINEVITNALKYAFIAHETGRISVTLRRLGGGRAMLEVADNGAGFDQDAVKPGMGSRLIKGMVHQLDGTYRYRKDSGTIFEAEIILAEPGV